MIESTVSEGLNSVETFHAWFRSQSNTSVSEGLNSVETDMQELPEYQSMSEFQKDLIVWKRSDSGFSLLLKYKFQKDLIVWKLSPVPTPALNVESFRRT